MYKEDFVANRYNTKGLFIVLFFRISSSCNKNIFFKLLGFPIRILYRLIVIWLLGCDIPDSTKIGKGLKVYHGQGLVVNSDTIIGENVTLRQNTTIGNANDGGPSPIIMNNVQIGANSVLIGDISIGENTIVGAGSVVVKSIAANAIVVGTSASIIKYI